MPSWNLVQPHHVRQAAAEYDRLGQKDFLELHHFGRATAYLLRLDGKSYDSKAILGVSHTATRPEALWVPTTSAAAYTAPPAY